jgi:hypothetical protein
MTTVMLYTQSLEYIETLNTDQVEVTHTAEIGKRFSRAKARTNLPHDLQAISNSPPDLIARLQVTLDEDAMDEVCRIDRAEWTYQPGKTIGGQDASYAQFELTPLHKDAQQIVKAVLDKPADKQIAHTVDYSIAYNSAMTNIQDMLQRMRRQDLTHYRRH